jgi:hypothetical protein
LIHLMNMQHSTGNLPYSNRPYSVGSAVMFWNTRHDRRRDKAARRIILPGRQAEDEGHHGDELPIAATASDVRDAYAVHPNSEAMFNFVLALRSGHHRPHGRRGVRRLLVRHTEWPVLVGQPPTVVYRDQRILVAMHNGRWCAHELQASWPMPGHDCPARLLI